MKKKIIIAHSPDSDDAFMFYGLSTGIISSKDFELEHHISDIETLNQMAFLGKYDITAISFNAFSKVLNDYDLMPCGASFGENYGPIVISKEQLSPVQLNKTLIAVPGEFTTAFLLLKHYIPNPMYAIVPFDTILSAVIEEKYQAGLIIHEGQLTYKDFNLFNVLDLGALWFKETTLPLPLGGLAIKKIIPENMKTELIALVRESVNYSLTHFEDAFAFARTYSRNANDSETKTFINMYVNELTLNYPHNARKALQVFSRKFRLPDISKSLLEK